MRSLKWIGWALIVIGGACLAAVGLELVQAATFQSTAAQALERQLQEPEDAAPFGTVAGDLIGRLEIPRLNLSVMVVEGEDEELLARAVGHLPDTALPWESGHAVFAGHRDTFFRPLKDLRDGDAIRLTTIRGTFAYRVTSTKIVEPDDVSVLAPRPVRSLTLVTCYPFVYVGRAPKRFIVHALPE
jgi:sortase A